LSDKLVESSAQVGRLLREGLLTVATRHRSIANVRGEGLLIGFDLVFDQEEKTLLPKEKCIKFFKGCLADGLIMMGYTPRVRINPPLILSAGQATAALAIIDRVLERTE
jgi:4-aminobutyrate aminotransferase-like enzyme